MTRSQNVRKYVGYKIFNCEVKADIVEEDILKGVDLPAEKLAAIKSDPEILKLIEHNLKAKREANQEARTNRERLEKLEAEKKANEEASLKKKGEFEQLYAKSKEELSLKDQKIKEMIIQKEIGMQAVQMGIKKTSYLKLLDTSKLEVDLDTLSVSDAKNIMERFKEENPDFFTDIKRVEVNASKAKLSSGIPEDDDLKKLELKAKQSRLPRDIAAWQNLKRELESK